MVNTAVSSALSAQAPRYAGHVHHSAEPNRLAMTQPADRIYIQPRPVKSQKNPVARTLSGLKNAAGPLAWTTLWSLLTIKGTVFCCGLLGLPFVLPAALSAGKALGKFKEGYNKP
jgi:hypothetical protein